MSFCLSRKTRSVTLSIPTQRAHRLIIALKGNSETDSLSCGVRGSVDFLCNSHLSRGNYKSKSLKVFRKGSNCIEQMKNHPFKKIYSTSERTARIYGGWAKTPPDPPRPPSSRNSTVEAVLQESVFEKVELLLPPNTSQGLQFHSRRTGLCGFSFPPGLCCRSFIPDSQGWGFWGSFLQLTPIHVVPIAPAPPCS